MEEPRFRLQYNLDVSEDSRWRVTTPTAQVRQLPLYLLEWGHFRAGGQYYTDREGAEMHLLFYTLRGRGRLTYRERECLLEPDTVALIDGRLPHQYHTDGETGMEWDFLWAQFDGTSAAVYNSLINQDSFHVLPTYGEPSFRTLMESLEGYIQGRDTGSSVAATSVLIRLLSLMALLGPEKRMEKNRVSSERLTAAVAYMDSHYGEKLLVEDLAKQTYLSKYHFIRVFTEYIGVSPYEYLTSIRISRAKELLNTTGYPLEVIAQQVGFGDSKALIRRFKQMTGMTPNRYRKLSG